eukprot:scaffold184_cov316-Pinguiococcus_pyrenoidosus.AAC.29
MGKARAQREGRAFPKPLLRADAQHAQQLYHGRSLRRSHHRVAQRHEHDHGQHSGAICHLVEPVWRRQAQQKAGK